MNKNIIHILLLTLISSCSLDSKTGFWSKTQKLEKEKIENVSTKVFQKPEILEKEFNTNIKIKLKTKYNDNFNLKKLTNNDGLLDFNGQLNKVSKFKFSKIDQFQLVQTDLLFTANKSVIFFDNKGTIFNFDSNSKLIWKVNHYSKKEKKMNPVLFFASNNKILVIADNMANIYAVDMNSGKLIWKKNNSSQFNSQIKIYKNKIFVIDFEDTLRCISIKNGKELWNFTTESSFIKSEQKLSMIIKDNKLVFLNSIGDLSSVNIDNGNLIWQTPTRSNKIIENSFSLKNSDLVLDKNSIYFSNNKNEFFSIDFNTGLTKWKQNINSSLKPTIIDNLVFALSKEGYLIIVDSNNGNIIRITYVFDQIKKPKEDQIESTGFIVAKENVYISLNNGKFIIAKILNGKTEKVLKFDRNKISRAYILNKKMYLISDNAILKLN